VTQIENKSTCYCRDTYRSGSLPVDTSCVGLHLSLWSVLLLLQLETSRQGSIITSTHESKMALHTHTHTHTKSLTFSHSTSSRLILNHHLTFACSSIS